MYDWWEIQQVKNVSKEKTSHPCQIPLQVMLNIIMLIPSDYLIIDPFAGSGTTLLASKILHKDFIGIEIDKSYCEIIEERLAQLLL